METYDTKDLGLAAGLLASDVPLNGMDKTNPKKIIFKFLATEIEGIDEIETLVRDYWDNHLNVSAFAYHNALASLKSRIYE